MKKTAIILSFLLFFILISIPFSDIVKATTNYTDFSDGTVTQQYISGWLSTTLLTGTDFNVNVGGHTEAKCFRIGNGACSGYWNYTYSSDEHIYNWTAWFLQDSSAGAPYTYLYFRNSTNANIITLKIRHNNGHMYNVNHLGADVDLGFYQVYHDLQMLFTAKDDLDFEAEVGHVDTTPSLVSNNYRITSIYITSTAPATVYARIDEHRITTNVTTAPVDFGTYNTIGGYPPVVGWNTVTTPTVEFRYDLPFTGKIGAFDFFVAKTTGNVGDYRLSINGCPNIVATEIGTYDPTPSTPSSYLYYIRWDFSTSPITLSNADNVLMELYALNKPASPWDTGYWFPNIVSTLYYAHGDVDGDGEQTYKTNSNTPNNVYYGTTKYYDLYYLLYYEGSGSVPVSPPTDYNTLNIYGSSTDNTSGNSLFKQNDSVYIEYSISDVVLPSYIRLYEHDNPTEYTEQIFPFHILPEKNKGTIGYIATEIGNFNISLFVNGVNVLTRYIDVVINTDTEDTNFEVYTIPPITDNYAPYDVYYNYFSTSYDGYLMVFDSGSGIPLDLYNGEFASYFITHNTTGVIHFTHAHKENNHYWKLFVYINGAYYQKGSTHMHLINNQMVNSLSVSVGAGYEGVLAVAKISYTHTLLGSDVVLYINNNSWRNVGSLSYNIETYPVTKAGSYQVDLYLVENNGSRIKLCPSVTFKVAGETPIDDTPDEILTFIDTLPLYVKIISSLVIIVVMTLIPMLVSVGLSRGNISINIPSLVYVAFFFLGMITTVLIGLLEIWIFGIVLFGLILAFAILWTQKKSEGG